MRYITLICCTLWIGLALGQNPNRPENYTFSTKYKSYTDVLLLSVGARYVDVKVDNFQRYKGTNSSGAPDSAYLQGKGSILGMYLGLERTFLNIFYAQGDVSFAPKDDLKVSSTPSLTGVEHYYFSEFNYKVVGGAGYFYKGRIGAMLTYTYGNIGTFLYNYSNSVPIDHYGGKIQGIGAVVLIPILNSLNRIQGTSLNYNDGANNKGSLSHIELLSYIPFKRNSEIGLCLGFSYTNTKVDNYPSPEGSNAPKLNSDVFRYTLGICIPISPRRTVPKYGHEHDTVPELKNRPSEKM